MDQQNNENKTQRQLRERIKELNCLYGLSRLMENRDILNNEFLQAAVNLIPPAWQYPGITCARLTFNEKVFITEGFKETPWKQSADIILNKAVKGRVEVFYIEEKPPMDEGPFLKEERNLIDTFAHQLAQYLVHKQAERKIIENNENLRITINSIGDAVIATDTKSHIARMNPVAEKLTGWNAAEAENQPLEKVFNIFDAKTAEKAENPVKEVLAYGKIVGLANDTKLISKNGEEYQIADSGSPIKNEHGEIIGVVLVFRDVTEDYQLREKLKQSEERFRTTLETLNEGCQIIGFDWRYLYVNPKVVEHGRKAKSELLGRTMMEVYPGIEETKLFNSLRRCMSERVSQRFENKFTFPDGTIGWFDISIQPIPEGIFVFSIDITERKEAEEKTLKSEQKFRDIFNHTGDAIVIQDMQGYFKEVNDNACQRSGYSREEFLNKHHFDIEPSESTKRIEERLTIMKQYGEATFETVFRRKDGSEMPVEGVARLTEFEGETAIISVVRDITERKKTEKVKQLLYNISQLSISDISLKQYLETIHKEVSEIMKADNFYIALYDKNSDKYTLPYHADEYDDLTTDEPVSLKHTLTDYIRKSGQAELITEEAERELRKKEKIQMVGTPSPVWIGAPIYDSSSDEVTGVIALQDYENKNTYKRDDVNTLSIIATNIGTFIERINNLENLKKAKEKAEESDRLKTAFLANMSHEIRTPMNGIMGFTNLLMEPDLTSKEKNQYTKIIHKSGQRMMNTVNDIVEISKIEAGIVSVQREAINANNVVEEIVSFFRSEAEKKGLTLELDQLLPGEASTLLIDKNKLESILTNLIKNAIKYTDSGRIQVGCRMKNNYVEFYVSDTGIGVPEDRRDAIFNRFEQADISDTRAFEGSGLGLAICKSYVEMLGGEIGLYSEENKGSTFYFNLPLSNKKMSEAPEKNDNPSQEEPSKKAETPGKRLKILIAEDDQDSFLYLKTLLKRIDCEIIQTITGPETVEKARKNPEIDLILMDIKLPEMNGHEATRKIREFNQKVPIIAQTAYAMVGDRKKALDAGCNEYVSKPIKKKELMEKINEFLKSKSL